MKESRVVLFGLICILPIYSVSADEVVSENINTFESGKAAIAKDVNDNFSELTRAINDNFSQINTFKNNSASIGGDGSGNTLSIGNANWVTSSPLNFNWTNCNIGLIATATAPTTLTVPSGTTIRCQNGFTLSANASIVVDTGHGAGIAKRNPTFGTGTTVGVGGIGIPEGAIRSSMDLIPFGGAGRNSGGYLRIQSNGPITINGTITANGVDGLYSPGRGGGSGGGIIVMQSMDSINIAGTVETNGGKGASQPTGGTQLESGGGGGGIVALTAPNNITISSNTTATGGAAGLASATSNAVTNGDGGSASAGNGGKGASNTLGGAAASGSTGYVIQMNGNPATMVP